MNAPAYRELEKTLLRALKGFSSTRQKLSAYERGVRDRVFQLTRRVADLRREREDAEADLATRQSWQ